MNTTRQTSTIPLLACYAAALAGAVWVVIGLEAPMPLWKTLWADLAATTIVFGFSVGFKNASLYDPYWSVAPVPIAIYWKYQYGPEAWSFREILFLGVVCFWSIRLTLNWYRGWRGMHHQDWRYTDLQNKTGRHYPLVNFFGIHLFPTLIVFLGCLPMIGFFDTDTQSLAAMSPMGQMLFGLGVILGFTAPVIQWFADEQMRRHRRNHPGAYIETGLWKHSRHPNYFGEILFWVSLALMGASSGGFAWWMLSGVAAMILLFVFISIPMMEEHILEKYPDYQTYRERVPMLVPWRVNILRINGRRTIQ